MRHQTGDFHSGVLYDNGAESRFLHLAGETLKDEAPKDPYQWPIAGFDDSIKKSAAAMCALIESSRPQIPYAFDRSGWSFDTTGAAISGPPGKGMTCSTFILAIFEAISFPLIQENQWPRGTDQADKWTILAGIFKGDRAESEHAQLAMGDDSAPRIRPAEVVASSAERTFPVPYPKARRGGESIERKLSKGK
jgi:hypothetical protein